MDKICISIKPIFFILLAIGVLILPLKFVFAWCVASLIHELGHLICLRLFKIRVFGISIDITGAKIHTEELSNMQECLVALAGPIAGMLLLPFARHIPRIALCALFQSVYNLIPIFPSDGGRVVLGYVRSVYAGNKAITVYRYFLFAVAVFVGIFTCVLVCYIASGWILMIPAMIFFIKLKFACKHSLLAVQ